MTAFVNYNDIRNSAPHRGRRSFPHRHLHAWQGIVFFVLIMIVLLLTGRLVYSHTESVLAATFSEQIILLLASLLFTLLMRADIREVFPVRKPCLPALFGVLVLILASVLAAEVFSLLTLHFSPESLEAASENMNILIQEPSIPVRFLLMCLCPAVCEEAVHRGVILNSFQNTFHDRRISIFLGGVFFGLFHIYPVRMIMPAFLGFIMSWMLLQTNNMLYGSLLHLGYNTLLILMSGASPRTEELQTLVFDVPSAYIGLATAFLGMFVPFLIYMGIWLVYRGTAPRKPEFLSFKNTRLSVLWLILSTAFILILGILIFFGLL